MSSSKAVSVSGIEKSFGPVKALGGISFEAGQGEIFGLIGPDGAGKTTLLRILATLMLPDAGRAGVFGHDVVSGYRKIRKLIGYMPGKFSLYQDLSVEENLSFFASLYGSSVKENYSLIRDIYSRLEPFRTRRAGSLSGGMKQKLALCCALIHRPMLLLLDEPTTGVDPVSRKEFWDILIKLKDEGMSVIVSTPYMDEARLCGRIALVREGLFLETGSPEEITGKFKGRIFSVKGPDMHLLLAPVREHESVASCYAFGDSHHVTVTDNSITASRLAAYLSGRGFPGVKVEEIRAGVEDCFLSLASGGEL